MTRQTPDVSTSPSPSRTGLGWGLGGSILASLCCLSPAVAVLFGLSGASFLFALPQYRVPLLLVGLGFSGLGVGMALRQSKRACSLAQHRRNRWLFPATALSVFVVAYGILAYGVPALVYNSLGPSAADAAPINAPAPRPQTDVPAPVNVSAPEEAAPPAREATPAAENPARAAGPRRADLAIRGMT